MFTDRQAIVFLQSIECRLPLAPGPNIPCLFALALLVPTAVPTLQPSPTRQSSATENSTASKNPDGAS